MLRSATRIALFLACAGLLAPASIASADDDYRRGRRALREFFRCALTPKQHFPGTIAEAAALTPELSTLDFALGEAGLRDALDGDGRFTVYAPTNAAFGALPTELLGFLLANPTEDLTSVLLLHVTPGSGRHFDPRRTVSPREVDTLQPDGQTVFYNRGPHGPQVNQSNVACEGVRASNGTVWFVDSVLLPQYLQ